MPVLVFYPGQFSRRSCAVLSNARDSLTDAFKGFEMKSRTIRLLLLLAALVAWTGSAFAQQIYKTVDENGNVVFTDIPPRDDEVGEQIVVEQPNSFSVDEAVGDRSQWIVEPDADEDADAEEPRERYLSLAIVSPADDEAIRENAGNITIVTEPTPHLKVGHRMRLIMDGQQVQEGRQAQFKLENVDRGTHTIATEILDEQGRVLIRSAPSTFHMLRVAIGARAAPS